LSNPDSFIDEVTEEMRRDRLFSYLRRYGWVGVVAVLGIVGGTAWNEYRQAQAQQNAQQAGDALMAALSQDDPAARAAAMADVTLTGPAQAIGDLLLAATQQEAGDIAAAAQNLAAVATNSQLPAIYRDIAAIKAASLPAGEDASRRAGLEQLAQPGQPLRLLALEQIAYLDLAAGDTDAAVAVLRQIDEDAAVTRGLRERVQTLMLALGQDAPVAPVQ
jgi:hypothetical protein